VRRLLLTLKGDNFDVKAALWLYTTDTYQWFLYIVSDVVEQKGITEAYKLLFKAIRPLANLEIDRFEVKLIGPADSLAKAVMSFLSKQLAPVPTLARGTTLGDVHIEQAYIYPLLQSSFLAVTT
jgi:hypothetical protein